MRLAAEKMLAVLYNKTACHSLKQIKLAWTLL